MSSIPTDVEAERQLLGALLCWDSRSSDPCPFPLALELVGPPDFWHPPYRHTYEAILDLFTRGETINVITVAYELAGRMTEGRHQSQFEEVGGQTALHEMVADSMLGPVGTEPYARAVAEVALKRQLFRIGNSLQSASMNGMSPLAIAEEYTEKLLRIGQQGAERRSSWELEALVDRYADPLVEWLEEPWRLPGVSTGWRTLDILLGGLAPSRFSICAADTGLGKSFFVQNLGLNVSGQGTPVLLFSTEMSASEVFERLSYMEARKDRFQIALRGYATDDEKRALRDATERLRAFPVSLVDLGSLQLHTLLGIARRFIASHPGCVILLDHIDQVRAEGEKRVDQLMTITKALKSLAVDAGVHILAVSHINRLGQREEQLEHYNLRDSSSKEQDANQLLLLTPMRHGPNGKLGRMSRTDVAEANRLNGQVLVQVRVAKNRHGAEGSAMMQLDWRHGGRFYEQER